MTKVKTCPNHKDYLVPLISTFAFPKKEWWCPYCGYSSGFFGLSGRAKLSESLKWRHDAYVEKSRDYLRAVALCWGGAQVKVGEAFMSFDELDEAEQERITAVVKTGWQLHVIAEDLVVPMITKRSK